MSRAKPLPDPPDGWAPSDFRDARGPWLRGLAEVKADEADHSGPDKALRLAKKVGWEAFLRGGNVHSLRVRLDVQRQHKARLLALIHRLQREERDASEATLGLEAADQNIAALEAVIAAAEAWDGGPDNVVLKRRLEQAEAAHKGLVARITPYVKARLPYPPDWDRELYAAEKALALSRAAFDAGRGRLEELSGQLQEQTAAAYQALAGCLGHVADRLGEACARIVHESDPEFLSSFPERAPDELIPIFRRALAVNKIGNALGARLDAVMARFWLAAGEVARPVVSGKMGLSPPPPKETRRGEGLHADIMGAIL